MMNKALVTGGSGFLGSYIVRELINSGIPTVSYDLLSPHPIEGLDLSSPLLNMVEGDIRNFDLLFQAMEGCDTVFHTAALANLDSARKMPVETMDINVLGTALCLKVATMHKIRRVIFASSVYTAGRWGSFYRVSKQAGEGLCHTFYEEMGLPFTIIRYGSLYGRDANHWNPIFGICKSLLEKGEFTYISSKESVREYIHIMDAARESVRVAKEDRYINKTVMITGHQRITVDELFRMIEEILGKKVTIHYTPQEAHKHYIMTPYSLEADMPERITMAHYIDISEGIVDCFRMIQKGEKN
jgi:UDP-glucose 4-epimerase